MTDKKDNIQGIQAQLKLAKLQFNSYKTVRLEDKVDQIVELINNGFISIVEKEVNANNGRGDDLFIYNPFTKMYTTDIESVIADLTFWQLGIRISDVRNVSALIIQSIKIGASALDKSVKDLQPYMVPVGNGILDMSTMELIPYEGSNYFITSRINVDYNPNAPKPDIPDSLDFDKFLDIFSCNNKERRSLVIQLIRATIFGKHSSKMFLAVGPGGDGKSTLGHIINGMIGSDNIAYLNFNDLSDKDKIANLNNKKFIYGDDNDDSLFITSTGILKQLSSSSVIQVTPKYKSAMNVHFTGAIWQTCNVMPKFKGANDAIKRRLVVVQANSKLSSRIDIALPEEEVNEIIRSKEYLEYVFRLLCDEKWEPFYRGFSNIDTIDTAEDIDGGSTVKMYIKTIFDIVDVKPEDGNSAETINAFPFNIHYSIFKQWSKVNYPGSSIMSKTRFNSEMTKILADLGYEETGRVFFRSKDYNIIEGQYNFICEQLGISSTNTADLDLDKLERQQQTGMINNGGFKANMFFKEYTSSYHKITKAEYFRYNTDNNKPTQPTQPQQPTQPTQPTQPIEKDNNDKFELALSKVRSKAKQVLNTDGSTLPFQFITELEHCSEANRLSIINQMVTTLLEEDNDTLAEFVNFSMDVFNEYLGDD